MPGHSMYIMPDGRPLTYYLNSEKDERKEGKQKHGKNLGGSNRQDLLWQQLKKQKDYIRKLFPEEEGESEFDYALKLGYKKRTRWINDRILRDMAGPMTASQMESFFRPPPWGEAIASTPFEILSKEYPQLYNMIVNVTFEKETEILKELEADLKMLKLERIKQKNLEAQKPSSLAIKNWNNINSVYKEALINFEFPDLNNIESEIFSFTKEQKRFIKFFNKDLISKKVIAGLCQYHCLSFKIVKKGLSQSGSLSPEIGAKDKEEFIFDIEICKEKKFYKYLLKLKKFEMQGYCDNEKLCKEIRCIDILCVLKELLPKGKKLSSKLLENYIKSSS